MTSTATDKRGRAGVWSAAACAAAIGSVVPGCVLAAFVGGVAESVHETGSTRVPLEYDGLTDRSFAVVVSADRAIESENPGVVEQITGRVDSMLSEHAGPSGHVPTATLLGVLYNNPSWRALARGQLGEQLGVQRLVVVELIEYRLHEPGNQYIWDGRARAIVQVYEIDGPTPDEAMFEKSITVGYPDSTGVLRETVSQSLVTSALSQRVADRTAWLFYDHDEPNAIEY